MPDYPDWQEVGPVRYVGQTPVSSGGTQVFLDVPVTGYERSIILVPQSDPSAHWTAALVGDTSGLNTWGWNRIAPGQATVALINPETETGYTILAVNDGSFAEYLDVYVGTAQPVIDIGNVTPYQSIPVTLAPDNGQGLLPAYVIAATSVSLATAGSHLLEINSGETEPALITRVQIFQNVAATAALFARIEVRRLTTAGTGGAGVPISAVDARNAAVNFSAQSLPGVLGAEGALLGFWEGLFVTGLATVPMVFPPLDYGPLSGSSPIRVPADFTSGLCVKNNIAVAGASLGIIVWAITL